MSEDSMFRAFQPFWLILLLGVTAHAQTTHSADEARMTQYVNNAWAYALKYDSLQKIRPALDSCVRFLDKYPRSFARPNVFSYMLKMDALITTDTNEIFPLVDSVLAYDSTAVTKMEIGETLVEQEIDEKRGAEILRNTLPLLTVPYHRYKTNLLLSRTAVAGGEFVLALSYIESAISIDSTRLDAWYAYLGYSQITENSHGMARASGKINEIRGGTEREYAKKVSANRFVGKSVLDLKAPDMKEDTVRFKNFAGKAIAVQGFNFWCSTPSKEFPAVKRLIKEFPEVKFIFLNGGETPDELKARYFTKPSTRFLKDQVVIFEDSSMDRLYGHTFEMGEILLIDRHGIVRYAFPGVSKDFEPMLRKKLGELNSER